MIDMNLIFKVAIIPVVLGIIMLYPKKSKDSQDDNVIEETTTVERVIKAKARDIRHLGLTPGSKKNRDLILGLKEKDGYKQ